MKINKLKLLCLYILAATCLVSSCAWYSETYHNPNRTCGYKEVYAEFRDVFNIAEVLMSVDYSQTMLGETDKYAKYEHGDANERKVCLAYIDFECSEDMTLQSFSPISNKAVFINPIGGIESPYVGEIKAHFKTLISINNGSPWKTLHNDMTKILSQIGYTVSDNQDDALLILDTDITNLDVRTFQEGFFNLKATTRATVEFNAVLRGKSGKIQWTDEIIGEHEIKVIYAYLKDSELALGQAYCDALKKYINEIQTIEITDMTH